MWTLHVERVVAWLTNRRSAQTVKGAKQLLFGAGNSKRVHEQVCLLIFIYKTKHMMKV